MHKKIFTLLLLSNLVFAQGIQSLEVIDEKIKNYIQNQLTISKDAQLKVSTDPIDPRLQLKACKEEQLEVFNPYNAAYVGNLTMGIRCQALENRWTLYLPAHIKIEKQVVIADHPILRGALITEGDLKLTSQDISLLKQGYYTDIKDVAGHLAKQTINQGNAVLPYNLERPLAVRKGQHVTIRAVSDMINVSVQGVAMENGSVNDKIRVQNIKSKRVVDAEIVNSKEVRVTL